MSDPRTAGERIDDLIATTPDWRAGVFARLRALIHEADPDIVETWKWVSPNRPGTPVFEHDGIVCHLNLLKGRVRLTLRDGASFPDPKRQFNANLEGNTRRAIDLHEGDRIDEATIRGWVRAGVAARQAAEARRAGVSRSRG